MISQKIRELEESTKRKNMLLAEIPEVEKN